MFFGEETVHIFRSAKENILKKKKMKSTTVIVETQMYP